MEVVPYLFSQRAMGIGKNLIMQISDSTVNWAFAAGACLWQEFYGASEDDVDKLKLCYTPEYCKLLRHIAIHGFTIENTLFIPIPSFFPDKFSHQLPSPTISQDLFQSRFSLAEEHNYIQKPLDSSGFLGFEEPEFLLFLLEDYNPWPGNEEALYGGFFKQGLEKWNIYYLSRDEYPTEKALQSAKAIVSNGAKYSANDDFPWINYFNNLLQKIDLENRQRIVGICLAHQIAGKAFGGTVTQNPCGRFLYHIETIRALNNWNNKLGLPETLKIHECHRDCVNLIPEKAQIIYGSDTCKAEIMAIGQNILMSQCHPEFTSYFVRHFHADYVFGGEDEDREKLEIALKDAENIRTDSDVVMNFFNDFLRKKINLL
ncbi:hypothetical protein SteCoe_14499 [Stentor coeruleus]|uniref:Glutamine amidotransferase domain-containing protein n=1 Tax=Stentor coeruleus TaxID=5963 RepID=A0A1R2C623_9CILI|nr:hypothetical protein SteCoe_14499 [Stentor coeruleus]